MASIPRRRWVALVASIGVAGALTAACTDRPNRDLNDYRAPAAATHGTGRHVDARSGVPTGHAAQPADRAHPATPTGAGMRQAAAVPAGVVLTDADVRSEGVHPVDGHPTAPLHCVAGGRADRPVAAWRYPTGSMLYQYVLRGPLPANANCGQPLTGITVPPGARRLAWCTAQACAAAYQRGDTVSVVRVDADQRERAAEAVRRLAPALAAHLAHS